MDLQGCYDAGKWMYDYACKLEKENKVLNNKVANLEKELEAYRHNKDQLERVVESDKTLIQDYERKVSRLEEEKTELLKKYLIEKDRKEQSEESGKRNTFSKESQDSKNTKLDTDINNKPKEYRLYKHNGKVFRYMKVEEKNQNGIVLVRWALID